MPTVGIDVQDIESVSSVNSDEVGRIEMQPTLGNPSTLRIDGKVPDVVYSLHLLDMRNQVINHLQSDKPFDKQAGQSDHCQESPLQDQGWPGEQPVIEVVNRIITERPEAPAISQPYAHNVRPYIPISPPPLPPIVYNGINYGSHEASRVSGNHSHIIIHSKYLINALRAVVAYYPSIHLQTSPVTIDAPYYVLYIIGGSWLPTVFLDATFGADLRDEEARHKLHNPVTTHEWCWTLFKPGQVVYAKMHGTWSAYIVSGIMPPRALDGRYDVYVWFIRARGNTLVREFTKFSVEMWEGEVPITSLAVVPEEYWMDDLQGQDGKKLRMPLRQKLIEEGKLLWELLKEPTSKQYNGELVDEGIHIKDTQKGFVSGRVVCDSPGFGEYCPDMKQQLQCQPRLTRPRSPPPENQWDLNRLPQAPPRCACRHCMSDREHHPEEVMFHEFKPVIPAIDETPTTDLFYVVCSGLIPGFIMASRRWGIFQISNLSDIKQDKEAFKYLVLDDKIKRTVKALISRFAASVDKKLSPWGDDFIKNKGEGRIFLLHGQPGVGKTSTAECIAELANRPLMALTSGDLLSSLDDVEKNLAYFLALGQRYGALVLLDEADVYLEHRTASDVARNGLVSIFLRALEYYRGVLFLTTNRVQSFDAAFLSRIHVALHYKNLSNENRERIWAHSFERLVRDSDGKIHVSAAARDYVFHHASVQLLRLNGREIRNAMQTALALAESEAEDEGDEVVTIRASHLEAVVEMSSSFKGYIARLEGRDGCEGDAN
ncbi:ATPase [Metarhizium guizhouense ARSEF 977]|uniref:ATPase n=1 Tax=Metarhizium guizhouense (strain ARSEF 977) TaxID=1276136 RepID=A0A0B4HCE3_METGA|nr:ATPase [Metarhizium guizhouense ARSEF 977]